jgi:hypothetical protein
MGLTAAVQEQIRRFVVEQVSADDLSDWLSAHAQQVLDSGKTEARRLMDLVFSLLEDEIQGYRTGEEIRSILASEVPLTVSVRGLHSDLDRTISAAITDFTWNEALGLSYEGSQETISTGVHV